MWIRPWTAWITTLLLPSIKRWWYPTARAAWIPSHMALASQPRLGHPQELCPCLNKMPYPISKNKTYYCIRKECVSSKLSLTYLVGGDLQPMSWVDLWDRVDGWCKEGRWEPEVRNFHLAQLRFSLTKVPIGLGTSWLKIIALRLFQILHRRITIQVREILRVVYK